MSAVQAMLQELEMEARTTRRVLERVPEAALAWKPAEKSMSMGQLALHVATMTGAIAQMSQMGTMALPKFEQPQAATAAELLVALEASLATARGILSGLQEADLGKMFRVEDGGREVLAMPVGAVLRHLMLNHWYHHRGQLSVYLRENGVPVPSIYGPSADENPFAA